MDDEEKKGNAQALLFGGFVFTVVGLGLLLIATNDKATISAEVSTGLIVVGIAFILGAIYYRLE